MRYLITGAAGFVGSHLTKALVVDGHQVFAIVQPGAPMDSIKNLIPSSAIFPYVGGVDCLQTAVKAAKPDVVYHLASVFLASHEAKDIRPLVESNVLFGSELLEAMTQEGVKNFVNTGTSWQHFESSPYRPTCLYAATKQAFEAMLAYYTDIKAIKAVTLKLFDTYGPNDSRGKLISALFDAAKTGRHFDMSPGEQIIDLVYIDDVVAAFRQAAIYVEENKDLFQDAFAVGAAERVSLRELVDIFNRATGSQVAVNWGARPYRKREVMLPWLNGDSLPGWRPLVSLENGFKKLAGKNV